MHRFSSLCMYFALASVLLAPPIDAQKRVKVFLLVGQSNMEGKGLPSHLDTYREDPLIRDTYAILKDGDSWVVRDDVFITYPTKKKGAKSGPLTVGYGTKGKDSIGPEFGFGHTVGEALDEPVAIIKIAWGGKSIARDFRPPSSPPTEEEMQAALTKAQRKRPKTTRADIEKSYGHFYRETIRHAKGELATLTKTFPALRGRRPEIAGFVWHQGFNDKINKDLRKRKYADYTRWLAQFIRDVRRDLDAPAMPVVIGELSTGGIPSRGDFQTAQARTADLPDLKGSVAFVKTAEFYDTVAHEMFKKKYWKGSEEQKAEWKKVANDRPYHYLGSGKTYYLKGKAFGEAMLGLLERRSSAKRSDQYRDAVH